MLIITSFRFHQRGSPLQKSAVIDDVRSYRHIRRDSHLRTGYGKSEEPPPRL